MKPKVQSPWWPGNVWSRMSSERPRFQIIYVLNNTCVDAEELNRLLETILSTSSRYGGFTSGNTTAVIWDFTGAFTFCVTIVTTIGYGYTHPVTLIGKTLCVAYALFGIPLALMVLSGIGEKLSALSSKVHRLQLNQDSPSYNKWINMGLLVGGGLLVMFIIPSSVFCSLENWNIIDSIYYCFITLSTIGFGDYIAGVAPNNEEPYRTIYRIAVYVWIFLGLSYISLVIKSLSKIFMKRAKKVQKNALKHVPIQRLPFMNGLALMSNTALGKNKGASAASEEKNSVEDEKQETGEANNQTTDGAGSGGGSNKDPPGTTSPTMHLSSAPTTKCRVQLKDVLDLAEPGANEIKLLKVSHIEPRY